MSVLGWLSWVGWVGKVKVGEQKGNVQRIRPFNFGRRGITSSFLCPRVSRARSRSLHESFSSAELRLPSKSLLGERVADQTSPTRQQPPGSALSHSSLPPSTDPLPSLTDLRTSDPPLDYVSSISTTI